MADDQVLRALGRALKLEQDGYSFYTQAAERVQDSDCKQTLLSLADDEKMHEAMIVRQLEAMSEDGDYVYLPHVKPVDIDLAADIVPPDPSQVEERVSENADELEALQTGMEIEMRSYDLYRQAALETESEAGTQMYEWLAAAEMMHFDLLMSNYEALNMRSKWV